MIEEKVKIFKLLADTSRLRIVSSLLKESMYVELISERLDLHPSTVSFHLKKLEQEGLVSSRKEQYYVVYHLNKNKLNFNIIHAIKGFGRVETEEEREEQYIKKVLSSFFSNQKLKNMPVQRKKRLIILKEIAKQFEIGKQYTEKEVNEIIKHVYEDFCTVRREFVDEKLFTRQNQIYERIQ